MLLRIKIHKQHDYLKNYRHLVILPRGAGKLHKQIASLTRYTYKGQTGHILWAGGTERLTVHEAMQALAGAWNSAVQN
jgi:NAD(P)H-hydrate repair Nnr-like enzyme with NAD(P)H-hydrate dehydratase domain